MKWILGLFTLLLSLLFGGFGRRNDIQKDINKLSADIKFSILKSDKLRDPNK